MTGLDDSPSGSISSPILPSPYKRPKRSDTPPFTDNPFIDQCLSHDHIIIIASFLHRQGMNALAKTNKTVRRRLTDYYEQMGEAMPHHIVYFLGGRDRGDTRNIDTVTAYDCVTCAWKLTPVTPLKRLESAGCIVGDFLYVFGGYYEQKIKEQAEVDNAVDPYVRPPFAQDETSFVSASVMVRDMHLGEWNLLEEMAIARAGHVALSNGPEILICGGWQGRRFASFLDVDNQAEPIKPLAQAAIFDTETQLWYEVCPMIKHRFRAFGVTVDGYAYIMGGMDPNRQHINHTYPFYDSCERFNFFLRRWELMPPMQVPRCDASCCCLDGKIYVFGGIRNIFNGEVSGEVFTPSEHQDYYQDAAQRESSSSERNSQDAGLPFFSPARSRSPSPNVDFDSRAIKEYSGSQRASSPVSSEVGSPRIPQGPRLFASSRCSSPMMTPRSGSEEYGVWNEVPVCRLREWFYSGDDDVDDFISRVVILGAWPYRGKVFVMITVGPQEGPVPMVMVFDPKRRHWQRTNIDLILPKLVRQSEDAFSNTFAVFPPNTH